MRNREAIEIRNEKLREAAKDERLSYRQLGKMFNLSGERARQIIGKSYRTNRSKEERARTIKELLPKAERMARKLGRLPKFRELKTIVEYGIDMHVLRTRLRQLGFKGASGYSREYLLDNIRELAKKLGRAPGEHDLDKAGGGSSTTYMNYFGSISKAQKAAGLVPTKPGQTFGKTRRHNDGEMLEHLRTLAKELGRSPNTFDVNAKGKYDATSYLRHFGGIIKARRKAGLAQPLHGMALKKLMRKKS